MLSKIIKIKLKVIGAIAVGLILIQIISAYFFGIMAQKQLDLQFKKITDSPLVSVVDRNYSRGWFSSNESVTLSVNPQLLKNLVSILPQDKESGLNSMQESYTISYSTHISQGLFAGWLHGSIMPTIAYAQTQLKLPAKLDNILNKFFNNRPALKIDNLIYPNKSGKFVVSSPDFNYDEALSGVKVNWGGLKLVTAYNPEFDHFENELVAPSFEMLAPTKGEVSFDSLDYASKSAYSVNNIKVGDTHLKLANIKIQLDESSTNTSLKLGQVIRVLTGINSADFLDGLDVINPTGFVLSGFSYDSLSHDQDGYFDANVVAGFESLQSNGAKFGPMSFEFNMNHVNAPAFSKLADTLNDMANQDQSNPDNRDKSIASLKVAMTPILVESPVVELKSFTLNTQSGQISLQGMATTHGFVESDMSDQNQFVKKMYVNFSFTIPKPTLAYLFLLQMKYFLTAGNVQMDKQSSDALSKVVNILLDNQLQVWLKKGYLSESKDAESNIMLSSKLTMESGVVNLSSPNK